MEKVEWVKIMMKKVSEYGPGLALVIALSLAASSLDAGEEGDAGSIRSLRAESNQAIASHDPDAIVSFFDEEYVISVSTGAIELGRDNQARGWAEHFAAYPDVVYVRTPVEITISEAYPVAMETGTWTGRMTTANGLLEKGGQYSAGWRKVDGVWRIRSELFIPLYCRGDGC